MKSEKCLLLIVGGSRALHQSISKLACIAGCSVSRARNNEAALAMVLRRQFDVVVTSEKTSASSDLELLRRIRRIHPHTRMIVLVNRATPSDVIAAMREQAFGLFMAPIRLPELNAMLEHAISAPPWDDGIEIVSATPDWIHLYARCDLATAHRLVQFIHEVGNELPETERFEVSDAFREMLVNAIEYGGRFDPNEYVEISYLRSQRAVSCRIKDPGKGFSLSEIPHAALSNAPDDPLRHLVHRAEKRMRPGGYGLLMMQNLVDEVIYGEKGNEVVFIKYLDQPKAASSENRTGSIS